MGSTSKIVEQGRDKHFVNKKTTYKTVNLKFGTEARAAIVRGIQRLAETVMITLGPGVSRWF